MRRYYIDFTTWELNADNEEQAEAKALALMKSGKIPTISQVDDTEDDEPFDDDNVECSTPEHREKW